jgi:hypothetical protein
MNATLHLTKEEIMKIIIRDLEKKGFTRVSFADLNFITSPNGVDLEGLDIKVDINNEQ